MIARPAASLERAILITARTLRGCAPIHKP